MVRMYILSVKEKPEDLEKILEDFGLIKKASNEWAKEGIAVLGNPNNLGGENNFTIRIALPGILLSDNKESEAHKKLEAESLEIYEGLKKHYTGKIIHAYSV